MEYSPIPVANHYASASDSGSISSKFNITTHYVQAQQTVMDHLCDIIANEGNDIYVDFRNFLWHDEYDTDAVEEDIDNAKGNIHVFNDIIWKKVHAYFYLTRCMFSALLLRYLTN